MTTTNPVGLIALDFDGTLVGRNGQVTERTINRLDRAAELGWVVVGATGRPKALCPMITDQVPAMRFLVASNGSEVHSLLDHSVIADFQIDPDTAQRVVAALRQAEPGIGVAVDCRDGTQRWEPGFVGVMPVAPLGYEVSDLFDVLSEPVRKIFLFHPSGAEVSPVDWQALEGVVTNVAPGVAIEDSGIVGVPEVRPREVSKATSLELLRRQLGVAATDTVCFGDSGNDIAMLRWANRGVAMATSPPDVLGAADDTTLSVYDDGIAVWLERNVLNL